MANLDEKQRGLLSALALVMGSIDVSGRAIMGDELPAEERAHAEACLRAVETAYMRGFASAVRLMGTGCPSAIDVERDAVPGCVAVLSLLLGEERGASLSAYGDEAMSVAAFLGAVIDLGLTKEAASIAREAKEAREANGGASPRSYEDALRDALGRMKGRE